MDTLFMLSKSIITKVMCILKLNILNFMEVYSFNRKIMVKALQFPVTKVI